MATSRYTWDDGTKVGWIDTVNLQALERREGRKLRRGDRVRWTLGGRIVRCD